MLRGMSRLGFAFAVVSVMACTKSSGTEPSSTDKPVGTKITVPDKGAGGEKTVEMKGGGQTPDDARFKLQPNEGKLAVEIPADVKPGTEAVATITVTPASGFHVNTEYPTKLVLDKTDGVTLAKAELKAGGHDKAKGDADALDEQKLAFAVKLTAANAGNYTINGSFKFAVCDKDQCLPKREAIAIALAAK
jgi:hypothetical protein